MSQLEKRKFRKGAVHNRKKVFTENSEKIIRKCNLCQKDFEAVNKFMRFCELCKLGELYYMTLTEFVDKLNELKNDSKNADSEIYFFTEDDYNTFDVKIENIEIEDNKIFLS